MFPRLMTARATAWVVSALGVAGLLAVGMFVDLKPKVEGDFFFADDDPQLRSSRAIEAEFGSGQQVIVRVADLAGDPRAYEDAVAALSDALAGLEGVTRVYSISTDDPRGPLFGRVLLTPDTAATNIILQTDGADPELLVPRIEAIVGAATPEVQIVISGAPVIVELIRRSLFRDLLVFSLAAVVVFAFLIGVAYRDAAILVGTLVTCAISVNVTLLIVQAAGVSIGLLTANLVTIVFVLTLSHVVFLTANWLRAMQSNPSDRAGALAQGIRDTLEGSFWSMTTTLLGFLSLLIASAKPLRELGMAGAVGTVTAMAVAYSVYPAFLGRWARGTPAGFRSLRLPRISSRWGVVGGAAAVVLGLGAGVSRLDTDPGLLTYFSEGTELREGLERIDRDGGSSVLNIVARDAAGGRVDTEAVYRKMSAYQQALEADPVVGVVLSPAVLIDQARRMPLAGFLPLSILIDIASSPQLDRVALGFVTADRERGLFSLRLRESVAIESRDAVMARLTAAAVDAGLEPVRVGGLFDLQAQLGRLIRSSLRIGIGGLMVLFLFVAAIVSRSPGTTARMWLCLAGIPLVVLGTFGWFGVAVDIITSPAANVALAMGVDSMIHLVVRARRLGAGDDPAAWGAALAQIRGPILAASSIICAGFGIFVLSTFPPTQRFGLAVILGTVTAATMAVVVLPRLVDAGSASEAGP